MAEGFCTTAILYFILVLSASGTDILYGSWTGMESLFAPFSEETGRLILMPAICNVLFSTAEVLLFLRRCDQHVSMRCYEIRAGNRVHLYWSQKKDLYRLWMAASAGYASVHVLLNIIFETGTWMSVIYMLLAFLLTSLLWLDSLYFLRTAGCGSRETLFALFLLNLVSLLLLPKLGGISFFAYGSIQKSWLDFAIKMLLEIAMFLAGFIAVKKRDLL